jgi:hypothetical protein
MLGGGLQESVTSGALCGSNSLPFGALETTAWQHSKAPSSFPMVDKAGMPVEAAIVSYKCHKKGVYRCHKKRVSK